MLAFLANAVVSYPITWLFSDIPEYYRTILYFPSFFGDLPTVVPRLIVVAIVLGFDFHLVRRWCRESPGVAAEASGPTMATLTASTGLWSHWNASPQWQRLMWQEWRSSKSLLWPIALTYVLLAVAFLTLNTATDFDPGLLQAPLLVVGGLVGTFVFHDDQRRGRYRFLAEHGVSPRRLWWTRQAYWFAILLACCLAALLTDYVAWRVSGSLSAWDGAANGGLIGLTLINYSVGQLLSLTVRSVVVRVTVTALCGILLGLWAAMMAVLGVPLIFSVAPIPLVLWVASRASVRDWMVERTGRTTVLKKSLLLAVPALALLAGVIAFRWFEIPNVTPEFATPAMTTAQRDASKRKGIEYLRAMEGFDPLNDGLPGNDEWVNRRMGDPIDPADFTENRLSEEQMKWLHDHRTLIDQILAVAPGEYILPSAQECWAALAKEDTIPHLPKGWHQEDFVRIFFDRKMDELPTVLIASANSSRAGRAARPGA